MPCMCLGWSGELLATGSIRQHCGRASACGHCDDHDRNLHQPYQGLSAWTLQPCSPTCDCGCGSMLPGAHTHAQCCVLAHALSHPATSPSPVACSIEAQLVAAQMASAMFLMSGHTSLLVLHGDDVAAGTLPDTILLGPCCPLPPPPTAACCTPACLWRHCGA